MESNDRLGANAPTDNPEQWEAFQQRREQERLKRNEVLLPKVRALPIGGALIQYECESFEELYCDLVLGKFDDGLMHITLYTIDSWNRKFDEILWEPQILQYKDLDFLWIKRIA